MDKFAQDLLQRIQSNVLAQVSKAELINVGYNSTKIDLPKDMLKECYENIDTNKIKQLIIKRLEEEVADKIVNKLITEYSNDVKQIMSNTELREDLRGILRNKIKETKQLME